ncbi:MAG: dual specificity protein phosphatase family protein [Acinetobacter sp.]|uniref:dual specificity protein phosphatase family protein n=1 Tax=Acinetobacter sp. TaxID=472 RepID=UPI003D06AA40
MKKIIIALVCCINLSACMTSPALPLNERPDSWGELIQRDSNFYQIDHSLYRSEQPSAELSQLIQTHQIDVIINLRARHKDPKIVQDPSIEYVHLPIHTWQINREDLLQVMRTIQQAKQKQQKVLIHCYHGSDRTGASVAMYRIIFQGWSIEAAKQEMKHGGYGYHSIWKNIDQLLNVKNVRWIQEQLLNPS